MEWTMPRPVVQGVAALMALGAAGSFAMGIVNAPEHGRMPGERVPGAVTVTGAAINATDATPLSQDRIEAPPRPVEKSAAASDNSDDDEADTATNATAPPVINPPPPAGATNATPVTPAPDTAPPPQEEPPH
jgi:hypothetical protein